LAFWEHEDSTLTAVNHLMLVVLHNQPSFLQTAWLQALASEMKKLIDTYHPTVLEKYAETLIMVLQYLSQAHGRPLTDVEGYFDFRFINVYLCNVLSFSSDGENPKIFNKRMRARKYEQVLLAVRLLKEMSSLYLKQKEEGGERLPFELSRSL
jgi:hypothetical protein